MTYQLAIAELLKDKETTPPPPPLLFFYSSCKLLIWNLVGKTLADKWSLDLQVFAT
jgi:hypothetical protein